jgi:8-amino-7-oxononanoate synthase
MPQKIPERLIRELLIREQQGSRRILIPFTDGVDVSSNDYLGLAQRLAEPERLARLIGEFQSTQIGATGSRLVTGTTNEHAALEDFLADFHHAEAALLFGSGYEANVGLLASIASRTDTIVYDEAIHASMRDGIRLSHARAFSFRHNDLEDLRTKLSQARGETFIAVESLYSMDGDLAPLQELCTMAEESGAFLLVDEAHTTGVRGANGEGLVVELGLEERVFARIHTFGKALGYRGACVVGPAIVREHLINSARPFIYSTAPDVLSLRIVKESYELTRGAGTERRRLKDLIGVFKDQALQYPHLQLLPSSTQIQGVLCAGNERVIRVERHLRQAGFFARGIRSPSVNPGTERIRVCLHAFNTAEDLSVLLETLRSALEGQVAA